MYTSDTRMYVIHAYAYTQTCSMQNTIVCCDGLRRRMRVRSKRALMCIHTYTQYEKYNCVLRRWPKEAYEIMVEKGATFTTTIHVLVSAVQKLASVVKMPDGLKLYRGLGGVIDLPRSFFKPHANGGRGFTEWGFMSTTSDKHVAIHYSSSGNRCAQVKPPMVLELTVSAVDRGACIIHLSQYPHEVEYLWVPCR
jgi:hypothetical protein